MTCKLCGGSMSENYFPSEDVTVVDGRTIRVRGYDRPIARYLHDDDLSDDDHNAEADDEIPVH